MRCAIHGNGNCPSFPPCTGRLNVAAEVERTSDEASGASAPGGLQTAQAALAGTKGALDVLAPAISIALQAGALDPKALHEATARVRAARVDVADLRGALDYIEERLRDAERALTDAGNATTAHEQPAQQGDKPAS